MEKENYRNYNLGRKIDEKTKQFEKELEALVEKYEVYMDTETFYKRDE